MCCKSRQQICTGEAERIAEKEVKDLYLPSRCCYGFTSPTNPLSWTYQHHSQSKNCPRFDFQIVLVAQLVCLNHPKSDTLSIRLNLLKRWCFRQSFSIYSHDSNCDKLYKLVFQCFIQKNENIQGNNLPKIEKIPGNNFLLSDEMHKKPLLLRLFSFTIRLFSPLFSQHELI